MRGVKLLGNTDAVFAWDGRQAYLAEDMIAGFAPPLAALGMAAFVQCLANGMTRVFRDRLGMGKLFWSRDKNGALLLASRPIQLVRAGCAFESIAAVPRGSAFLVDSYGQVTGHERVQPPSGLTRFVDAPIADLGAQIRRTLDEYLAAIAASYPRRRAYVCLSGGLDSSTIAVLVKNHFADVVAVSFDLARPGGEESADRVAARRLADDLGLELMTCSVTVDELLEWIDLVLMEGIDWRDFNVHAALVNAALAQAIARHCNGDRERPLVITGDLSNEFLVDYKAETFRGGTYYSLPRVGVEKLRDILIQGLETTHREAGIFQAWDLPLVQPFAAAVEAYLSLPGWFLQESDRKDRLVQAIVGSALPSYIYERPKVRAQLGGTDAGGGVLGACIDRGIDAAFLRRRFAQLHEISNPDALAKFIRAGRYRSAVPSSMEATA